MSVQPMCPTESLHLRVFLNGWIEALPELVRRFDVRLVIVILLLNIYSD